MAELVSTVVYTDSPFLVPTFSIGVGTAESVAAYEDGGGAIEEPKVDAEVVCGNSCGVEPISLLRIGKIFPVKGSFTGMAGDVEATTVAVVVVAAETAACERYAL